jgi:hypothetical protein
VRAAQGRHRRYVMQRPGSSRRSRGAEVVASSCSCWPTRRRGARARPRDRLARGGGRRRAAARGGRPGRLADRRGRRGAARPGRGETRGPIGSPS